MPGMNRKRSIEIIKNWLPAFITIFATLALRSAIADWNDVPTGSMNPTIIEGDRIFVNKAAYDLKIPFSKRTLARLNEPERGDIVVFDSPENGKRLVKRLIGLPGDTVEMKNNILIINGSPLHYTAADRGRYSDDINLHGEQCSYRIENLDNCMHPVKILPYQPSMRSFDSVTIPEDYYLMMGDNRDNSADSRYFGLVPRELIKGEATAVVVSLQYNRYLLPRSGRLFKKLQ